MRKQTHLKKALSLALAAAMAVSVCTTALADEPNTADMTESTTVTEVQDDEITTEQPVAEDTEKKQEESETETPEAEEDKAVEDAEGEEQADVKEETLPTDESSAKENSAENDVALLTDEETTNPVSTTLQEQINAAQNGDTITLDKDYTEKLTIDAGKSLTLNLNGHTLANVSGTRTLMNSGELIVVGPGTIKNDAGKYALYNNGGKLTIVSGRIEGELYSAKRQKQNPEVIIKGGEFLGNVTNKVANTMTITGGTFKNEPSRSIINNTDYEAVASGDMWVVQRKADVAKIGETGYTSLGNALAAVQSGDTIQLLASVSSSSFTVKDGKKLTIDLNGQNITLSKNTNITVENGSLNVTGQGSIIGNTEEGKDYPTFNIVGSDSNVADYSVVTIGKDVTVSNDNWYGIGVRPANKDSSASYGVKVNIEGKIVAPYGITVNGAIKEETGNIPEITIAETGEINSTSTAKSSALYAAGYGKYTVNGTVKGTDFGVEIRAGELVVGETAEISSTTAPTECEANGNGSTTKGAGVSISQHSTGLPVTVTINGGTISACTPVYEVNPQNNPDSAIEKVHVTINNGKFNGKAAAVYAKDESTTTIVNGLFNIYTPAISDLNKLIRTEGMTIVENTDPDTKDAYPFTVGKKEETAEVTVNSDVAVKDSEVKAPDADAKIDTGKEKEVKDVASKTSFNTKEDASASEENPTQDTLEKAGDAAVKKELTPVIKDAKEDQYKEEVSNAQTELTYVVMPYLDIQPKAYTETVEPEDAGEVTVLTLDITPKYNLVLTDKDTAQNAKSDPNEIRTENSASGTKNAIVVSEGNDLKVEGTVKLDLPVNGDVVNALTGKDVFVLHDHEGTKYIYEATLEGNTISFENPNGFSDFSIVAVAQNTGVTINFEGIGDKSYTMSDVAAKTEFPAASKDGYTFKGWQIGDKIVTNMDYALWTALDKAAENAATPVFEKNPAPAASGDSSSASTPAPTATTAPSVGGSEVYYTCVACGHHDWTATAEGYKCNYCDHLESVKQLSGYANVKGTYEPKTSTAKAAAAGKSDVKSSSAIPQTSDDMPIIPIAVIAIAALLGLGVTVVLKRKHN